MTMIWSNKLQTWRKKVDRRVENRKSRSEKQATLSRHKQGRKAAMRRLRTSSIDDIMWLKDRLVYTKTGQPIPLVSPKRAEVVHF